MICTKRRSYHESQSEQLRGAKVYIIPDLDEPGAKHAQKVARALDGVAREVRIINLGRQDAVKLPPKGDISDLYLLFHYYQNYKSPDQSLQYIRFLLQIWFRYKLINKRLYCTNIIRITH